MDALWKVCCDLLRLVVCWLVSCQLVTSQSCFEWGNSVEKIPSLDWPVDKPLGQMTDVGEPCSLWVSLLWDGGRGSYKKASWANSGEQTNKQVFHGYLSVPALNSLHEGLLPGSVGWEEASVEEWPQVQPECSSWLPHSAQATVAGHFGFVGHRTPNPPPPPHPTALPTAACIAPSALWVLSSRELVSSLVAAWLLCICSALSNKGLFFSFWSVIKSTYNRP